MGKKKQLSGDVSKAYYQLVYFQERHELYLQVDSLYFRFSQAAQTSYEKGAISYLEMLNAQSRHNEVSLLQAQMQHDIEIAYEYDNKKLLWVFLKVIQQGKAPYWFDVGGAGCFEFQEVSCI